MRTKKKMTDYKMYRPPKTMKPSHFGGKERSTGAARISETKEEERDNYKESTTMHQARQPIQLSPILPLVLAFILPLLLGLIAAIIAQRQAKAQGNETIKIIAIILIIIKAIGSIIALVILGLLLPVALNG